MIVNLIGDISSVSTHCMISTLSSHSLDRLTSDGKTTVREIVVAHSAAKSMIELIRTLGEECGHGSTSVIILGGFRATLMLQAMTFSWNSLREEDTRTVVNAISGARHASRRHQLCVNKSMKEALPVFDRICDPIDVNDGKTFALIETSIGIKFVCRTVVRAYVQAQARYLSQTHCRAE